jgi:hypothetical protein
VPEGAFWREVGADSGQTVWHVEPPLGEPEQSYWWRVRAHDGLFNGLWSAATSFTVIQGVMVELSDLSATEHEGRVDVVWTTVGEGPLVGFHLYRAVAEAGPYTQVNREWIRGKSPYRYRDETVEVGRAYYYTVEAVDPVGGNAVYGPVAVMVRAPERYLLGQNMPNPFNPETVIAYQVPTAGQVTLTVYNLRGQVVRRLVDGRQPAGYYRVRWDGRDRFKREVASGVYVYRIALGTWTATRKMVLVK